MAQRHHKQEGHQEPHVWIELSLRAVTDNRLDALKAVMAPSRVAVYAGIEDHLVHFALIVTLFLHAVVQQAQTCILLALLAQLQVGLLHVWIGPCLTSENGNRRFTENKRTVLAHSRVVQSVADIEERVVCTIRQALRQVGKQVDMYRNELFLTLALRPVVQSFQM